MNLIERIDILGYRASTECNYICDGDNGKNLKNLSKVNIFLGSNNSGKSRFLRAIFNDREFKYVTQTNKIIDSNVKLIKDISLTENAKKNIITSNTELKLLNRIIEGNLFYQEGNKELFQGTDMYSSNINKSTVSIFAALRNKFAQDGYQHNGNTYHLTPLERDDMQKIITYDETHEISGNFKKIYIPILRGLSNANIDFKYITQKGDIIPKEQIEELKKDNKLEKGELYMVDIEDHSQKRTKEIYFPKGVKENCEIFTGGSLYKKIRTMLLGDFSQREIIKKYEDRVSKTFFENKPFSITPIEKDSPDGRVLNFKLGDDQNDKDYPIYNLGDGIQSIIIATFPLFEKEKDKEVLLFIEEPELYMHPGLQRKLMEVYASDEFPKAQIYCTTHSNHLLDVTLDYDNVSVYTFEKKQDVDNNYEYHITHKSPSKDILNLLGIRNSSVFLSNCVIWVEGISDRIYLKKYLELYLKYLKEKYKRDGLNNPKDYFEDKHYSFAEFGGGNIAHMTFDGELDTHDLNWQSITNNNFIVHDNDGKSSFKGDIGEATDDKLIRLNELYNKFGETNFFADHYEIEQTLPYSVWKQYCTNHITSGQDIKVKDLGDGSEKRYNEQLGKYNTGTIMRNIFIDKKEGKNPKYFKYKDIATLGKDKAYISKAITDQYFNNITFEDLPQVAKNLTTKLFEFIERNNQS